MRITYDEISPITGNRKVMIEPDPEKLDNIKICMDSGYHTYDAHWKTGSDVIELVERNLPTVIIDNKKECDDGNTWYHLMMITPFVILTPEASSGGDIEWVIYSLKPGDPNTDDIIMILPNETEGSDPIHMTIDNSSRQSFPSDKFELAMDAYQSIGAAVMGKINEVVADES
jgi:hypothetical protein